MTALGYFLMSEPIQATSAPKHPCFNGQNRLCEYMVTLRPRINLNEALKLSRIFQKAAVVDHIPGEMLVSIAKQESDFRPALVRTVNGFVNMNGGYEEAAIGTDFCMMQINTVNIKRYKWDVNKLLTDPVECVRAAVIILKNSIRFKGKEPTWWTRYNAGTQKNRKRYADSVLKHWRQLDPAIDAKSCQQKI